MGRPTGRVQGGPPPVPLYEGVPDDRDAFWRRLREVYGEVAPVHLEPGVPAWLLLSYELNRQVMIDNATYRCDRRYWRDLEHGVIPADSAVRAINEKRESVLYVDGEEHQFLSRGLHAAFSALDQQRVLGQIQQVAEELVDGFSERGQADLIGEYARLLPLNVLGRLLGLSQPEVGALAASMGKLWGGGADSPQGAAELKAQLTDLARVRRAEPADDLPSHLIAHGQSDSQVCDQLTLIIAGTNDLVTNTIGAALRRLLMDAWLADNHAGSRMSISETINYVMLHATPMEILVGRFPTRDVRLGHYHIRAGDCLVLGFSAANADLLDRTPHAQSAFTRAHLTFGAGPHRCPRHGRDLGQAEAAPQTDAADGASGRRGDRRHARRELSPLDLPVVDGDRQDDWRNRAARRARPAQSRRSAPALHAGERLVQPRRRQEGHARTGAFRRSGRAQRRLLCRRRGRHSRNRKRPDDHRRPRGSRDRRVRPARASPSARQSRLVAGCTVRRV